MLRTAMIVSAAMSKPVQFVRDTDDAGAAADRMTQNDVGFLPVCDADGRVIGSITERDIVQKVVAGRLATSTPVSAVMGPPIPTCSARDDLFKAQTVKRSCANGKHAASCASTCMDDLQAS